MQQLTLSPLAQQKRATYCLPAHSPAWLHPLFDAYATLEAAQEQQLAQTPRTPACHKGCTACCTHLIPALPAEILGIRFYLNHGIPAELRHTLRNNLNHVPEGTCPFLHLGGCSIYTIRPMVCRRYLVFSQPCAPGEHPEHTRPDDIFQASPAHYLSALAHTFPIYQSLGLAAPGDTPTLPFFLQQTVLLASLDWHESISA
ncbi:YkgJ family cysteine cluster protein [Desulfovibrio cuneatus]|uniref:YkgJ family cysteine cluster protein n=1 Tax=Desulfovibrio cuneatus TaxID=159728 RepID=UPI00041EE222|nr:YkgJ family cysteine cluster protein [Desulfovibrio cuneatus]